MWDSGPASVALAALVFQFSTLMVKLLDGRVPVLQIVLVRSSLCALISILIACRKKMYPLFGHRRHLLILLARGVTGAAAMNCYYVSIQQLQLADAVTLFFLNPAITAVLAWLAAGEALGWQGALGVATSMSGLLLLTRPPFVFGGVPWDGGRVSGEQLDAWPPLSNHTIPSALHSLPPLQPWF